MSVTLQLPAHARDWPAHVRAAMQQRVDELAPGVDGAVFDLAEVDGGRIAWPDATFDTIVSIAELPRFADLAAVATTLIGLVRPGGTLVFVEPGARAGLPALIRASVGTRRATRGLHLNRDVPWTLRQCGWHTHRVDRDLLAGAPWALRFLSSGVVGPRPTGSTEPPGSGQDHGTASDEGAR